MTVSLEAVAVLAAWRYPGRTKAVATSSKSSKSQFATFTIAADVDTVRGRGGTVWLAGARNPNARSAFTIDTRFLAA